MRNLVFMALAVFVALVTPAYGKDSHYEAVVAEPFIELHTGPGRGYPVFHVVDRGQTIQVLKRRTDWFEVRAANGVEGWVKLDEMADTLDTDGRPTAIADPTADDYAGRRWEVGLGLGDLDGASVLTLFGAYRFTPNLSLELRVGDVSGDYSGGWIATADIVEQPFPHWWLSPYVLLGTGVVRIEPQATLVQTEDRTDQVAHVGAGVQTYLGDRFLLRLEYGSYLAFTSRDDNEELDEWTAGFAFFF